MSIDPRLVYRGVTYRSLLEVSVAKELWAKHTKGSFVYSYEPVVFSYTLRDREYNPDFEILRKDGSAVYVEVKGYFDRDSVRKMLAVKECNPDETFVLLFAKDNPIRKGAKMRYSDWCKKHGFDYSIGEVPDRWLKVEK
jgi:predicted nuclease of restriction endonuclease-like RecB superfamily